MNGVPGRAPVDEEEFRRWREEADRALIGARLQADGGVYNWACFGAEQSAQLALKGLLHGLGRGPWGHDLVRLGGLLREAGIELPTHVEEPLRRLGRHYIPARYPDAHASGPPSSHYGDADFGEAIRDAQTILAFVDEIWRSFRG